MRFAEKLTQDEFLEDPRDLLSKYVVEAAHQFSIAGKNFIILYLLSHGIIRLLLVVGLFKKRLEAYYLSFVVFSAFIVYQMYKYSHTGALWLVGLSAIDMFFIWLVWKEYTYVRSSQLGQKPPQAPKA